MPLHRRPLSVRLLRTRCGLCLSERDSEGGPLPAMLFLYDSSLRPLGVGLRLELETDALHERLRTRDPQHGRVIADAYVLQLYQGLLYCRRRLEELRPALATSDTADIAIIAQTQTQRY